MMQILDEKMVCNNAAQAEAAIKKHEAISAEILARVGQTMMIITEAVVIIMSLTVQTLFPRNRCLVIIYLNCRTILYLLKAQYASAIFLTVKKE